MAVIYAALNNARMVTVDTPEAHRAVTGFVDAWQASRAAFNANCDDTGMAYLRKAATHANAVISLYAHIHVGGVK
jgi:adenosine/AMP kinase